MLQALLSTVLVIASFVGGFFGGAKLSEQTQPIPASVEQSMNVGAALPGGENSFETSLQSAISSSATSLTLTANSLRGGGTLSGFKCFTIDEGTASREDVCGTVSGTAVTSLTRGLSPTTATTTIAALQFAHRRGANVKITDFPLIQILRNQANGSDTYDNVLVYTSHPTFTSGTQLIDKTYADGLVAAGVATSSEANFGGVWLGTATQQASSTDGGVNKPYVMQTKYASSSPTVGCDGTATAGSRCTPVASTTGKIAQSYLPLSESLTFSGLNTFSAGYLATASSTHTATTSIAASSVTNNALVLNTVAYQFPSTQGASSTVLANNGSGVLTAQRMQSYATGATTTVTITGSYVFGHDLGATPKMIKVSVATTAYTGTIYAGGMSVGTATSTATASQNVVGVRATQNGTVGNAYRQTSLLISAESGAGTVDLAATLSAWDSTTFTLNITTNTSVNKFVLWEVYQ